MRKPFVLSIAAISALLVGCSADVMRFDNPFSNPFTSSTKRAPLNGGTNFQTRQQPSYKAMAPKEDDSDIVTNSAPKRKIVEEVKQLPYNDNVSKAWQGKGAIKPAMSLPRNMVDESYKAGGKAPIGKKPDAPKASAQSKNVDNTVITSTARRNLNENVKQPSFRDNNLKLTPNLKPLQMNDASQLRGGWSPVGGTMIKAGAGDTVESFAKRYGVPASAIAQANGVSATQGFASGQSVVIPTYSINHKATVAKTEKKVVAEKTGIVGLRSQKPKAQETKPQEVKPQDILASKKPNNFAKYSRTHVVNEGESLGGIANRYNVKSDSLLKANKLADSGKLKVGQALVIPAAVATTAVAVAKPKVVPVQVAKVTKPKVDTTAVGSIPKVKPITKAAPVVTPVKLEEPTTAATRETLEFRWPVRAGRVISHYGQDLNGVENEGINIAVPEGTDIRAAEDGEVVYAGNGLKNYGNLVLIRHGEKYVTAYAHSKELLVKLGDKVKRGQVIAKAGQTGAVSSPQVHFEVRQGKQSIDPENKLSAM